jgi:hypothetical protein
MSHNKHSNLDISSHVYDVRNNWQNISWGHYKKIENGSDIP